MIGIKFTKKLEETKKRLQELPKFMDDVMSSVVKEDCDTFIVSFQNHLRNNDLGITALKQETIDSKKRKGLKKPYHPLYGKGDDEKLSYINMFKLKKVNNGWEAIPKDEQHHESILTLKSLFEVHEHGMTIKKGNSLIKIPPRPVAMLTYRDLFVKKKLRKSVSIVSKGILEYILEGSKSTINKFLNRVKNIGKDKE